MDGARERCVNVAQFVSMYVRVRVRGPSVALVHVHVHVHVHVRDVVLAACKVSTLAHQN